MPKGSKELTDARRKEIVDACQELYQSMSFKEITIKEIGKVISFTRTSIYNYFQTKEEIFLALLQREYAAWNEELDQAAEKTGTMTVEDLAEFLESFGISGDKTLSSIYQAIVQNPANYLKYYLGAVEILCLREEAQKAFGERFEIRDFHEFILSVGPAPFSVIRSYLYGWTGTD